jgi:hypothetical protein
VLVGEADIERDEELNQSRRLDRQQGATRVERGQRWVEAMRLAARASGLDTEYRFELFPDSDHSFTRSARNGKITARVFRYLFGAAPPRSEPAGDEARRKRPRAQPHPTK